HNHKQSQQEAVTTIKRRTPMFSGTTSPRHGAVRRVLALTAGLFLSVTAATASAADTRPVIFVGNNWEGMIDVIDAETYTTIGRIDGVPDKRKRTTEILFNPLKLLAFQAIRIFIGEGNDQFVDDMYSTPDGRLLAVSRPSLADVVGINIETNEIHWRFQVDGIRSDHMRLSPDGKHLAVSASTGSVVPHLALHSGR